MAKKTEKAKQSALIKLVKELKESKAELKESERRHRELFRHIRSGVAIYEAVDGGRDFIFKDFNKAGETIDRIKKEKLIGKKVTSVFPGAKAMGLVKHLREVWMTGVSVSLPESVYEDKRLGKTWRSNYLYRLPTGEVAAVYSDIPERDKAAEDLERLFDLATAMVCIVNFKGYFTKVSPAFMDVLGYSEKELLSKPFIRFVHPDDRASTLAEMGKIVKGKAVYRFMNRQVCKDGSRKFLEWTAHPVVKDRILFAIAYDVTERERALEETKRERDKISAIIQGMVNGLFVVDRQGKIVLFNKAAEIMSGYRMEDAIGKHYSKVMTFISENNKTSASASIEASLATGEIRTVTTRATLVNRSGNEIPVENSVAPLVGSEGEVFGCVVIFQDSTREHEIDQMKSEFISIATHQLHTPLTGIKWFIELLLAGRAGSLLKRQREYLINVHESNERMIRLINDLLNVSRIESGERISMNKEPVNVIKLFSQIISENISLARQNQISIVKCKGAPRSLILPVDEGRMRLAVSNILNNAIKYSKRGGRVEIGCEKEKDKEITFWIKDEGVGIPRKQQRRVFEKFFRADNIITKVTEGTGLGLYIAKSIIEAHGGRIWFESKEDEGSTFFFTISRNAKKEKRNKRKRRTDRVKRKEALA